MDSTFLEVPSTDRKQLLHNPFFGGLIVDAQYLYHTTFAYSFWKW